MARARRRTAMKQRPLSRRDKGCVTAAKCGRSKQSNRAIVVIIVSMTRKLAGKAKTPAPTPGRWRLQDARARFSALVRLAHSDGPQHVTLHGRDAVVVIAADDFQRLKGERTGQLLIDALQASPHRDTKIEPRRSVMPARDVKL